MKKTICYSGTRNLYEQMYVSLKSFLINTPDLEAYLFIEDDVFPYELDERVHVINASRQQYFREDGPNFRSRFSYMTLIRAALALELRDVDVILSLDCDTIATDDISDVFNINLDGYFFAASKEPIKSVGRLYCNTGVALYNLKLLRETGKVREVIDSLNRMRYDFAEQDCFNALCQGHIREMPAMYNANAYTEYTSTQKIVHYAGLPEWTNQFWYRFYKDTPLNGVK